MAYDTKDDLRPGAPIAPHTDNAEHGDHEVLLRCLADLG